ncbi:MAG TPA: amidohydrolase/deacetylase family metallohydrolase [Cyclobacteriaceae bacterium]|nr:amidohydrolase/deacetylase family metallohydrolase [Cyclobacteriaceae bacterium]
MKLSGILLTLFVLIQGISYGQTYDMVIKGGHVIDPSSNTSRVLDVAVSGNRVAKVAQGIPAGQAKTVVDATGLYVVPGLIDLHVHVFYGTEQRSAYRNSFSAVQPDAFSFRSGVTTMVDAGSPGWKSFETYRKQTISHSKTRIFVFLNIVGEGMKGGDAEQNIGEMSATRAARLAGYHPDIIRGFKLAHFSGHDWAPVDSVVRAGTLANLPVMIDFGGSTPELSLETLLMNKLRPGDIFTHAYAKVRGRTSMVDDNSKVRPLIFDARKRGIIFDVGHGGASLQFSQAIPAIKQGFKPDVISTDLHTGSMNAGMKDMLNVMSKFLNMGMSMEEVIACSTLAPANIIKRNDLGRLSEGSLADITLLKVESGNFGFTDARGWRMKGSKKLVSELTVLDGNVVWDLNGLTAKDWSTSLTGEK